MNRLWFISILLTILLALTACGSAPTSTGADSAASNEKMVEYVGEIPDTDLYVAIAVDSTGGVLAYVCNGMGIDYLFRGSVQANVVDLTSEAGQANLQASMDGEGFTGTFSVDGKAYPFVTGPVNNYGGLYHITALNEFSAEGVSLGGATITMNLTPDKERLQVQVITTDGQTLNSDKAWPNDHDHRDPTEYSETWLIALNDGRARGGYIKSSFQAKAKHLDAYFDPICPP
ncbi:MAG: hypothetical protein H7Y59_11980 [Anaerolineales bacterium]|nr:hypothetical protein [Anaerolineales bacterium]